jgi:hypothetical protein
MRTFVQSSGRRWYGQKVIRSLRSLVGLGVLEVDSLFFDQRLNVSSPLLEVLRSISVEFAPSMATDFAAHVFFG